MADIQRALTVDVSLAMVRLHAGRGIAFTVAGKAKPTLATEPEDFAEILSNLADNAGKWACSTVAIDWCTTGLDASITVTDDGPGVPESRLKNVLAVGNRLDEQAPGHGLGLAIARDLARRYEGAVALLARDDGRSGLMARLHIPLTTAEEHSARTIATT